MRILYLIGLIIFLSSCQNNDSSKEIKSEVKSNDTTETAIKKEEISIEIDSTKIPSNTFLKLVDFINESGYTHDTSFIKKVPAYRCSDSVFNVDGKLFYYLKPEQTFITELCDYNKDGSWMPHGQMFNEKLYKKAKYVYAYYYRENPKDDFVTDGFIEEWHFEDSLQAEKAYKDFISKNRMVIYKTNSFGKRQNNKIFVMYTRVTGFGIILDKFYQELKRIIN